MKTLVAGFCLMLVTGCTSTPVGEERAEIQTVHASNQLILPPPSSTHLRVGVEYLPPEIRPHHRPVAWLGDQIRTKRGRAGLVVADDPPRSEPHDATRNPPPRRLPEFQERWSLRRADIRKKRNPIERFALRFVSELIGDDRKRVQRAVGTPLYHTELRLSSDPMSNFIDQRDREDHERLLTKSGIRMFRRPSRVALDELPLLNDIELAIKDFKEANREYSDKNQLDLGRLSMHLRANNNPVEIVWIRGGLRLASSQTSAKASFSTHLTEGMTLSLRSDYEFRRDEWQLLGTLEYELNDYTTFYVLAGNEVNILADPVSFSGGPQSDESSRGVLAYFQHEF